MNSRNDRDDHAIKDELAGPNQNTDSVHSQESSFWCFLRNLGFDTDQAASSFVRIHQRLALFGGVHKVRDPYRFADRVLDLLQDRRKSGDLRHPIAAALALAKILLLEEFREAKADPAPLPVQVGMPLDALPADHSFSTATAATDLQDRLDNGLESLSERERNIILRFYGSAESEKKLKEKRLELAHELGLSSNALNVSAFQIRKKLRKMLT